MLADNEKLNELVKTQLKELRAKQGEIQIVRSRFDKVRLPPHFCLAPALTDTQIEADHKKLTEIERAAMRKLELSLETRDKEHRATVEMHKTEIAFQVRPLALLGRSSCCAASGGRDVEEGTLAMAVVVSSTAPVDRPTRQHRPAAVPCAKSVNASHSRQDPRSIRPPSAATNVLPRACPHPWLCQLVR